MSLSRVLKELRLWIVLQRDSKGLIEQLMSAELLGNVADRQPAEYAVARGSGSLQAGA
jgi:hypothetical protein